MKTRNWLISAAAGALCTGAMAGVALLDTVDYSVIPVPFSRIHNTLTSSGASLARAIEVAQEATGGVATSASVDLLGKETLFQVNTYTAENGWTVIINADGSIKEKKELADVPGEKVTGDWVVLESGLRYFELKEGEGPQPPSNTAMVKVHYTGWTVDGKKFDSSVDRGEPAVFPLNGVIAGWTEGVGSMKVGGRRKLIIPYKLAYGEYGRPGAIPQRATLIFDVELIEIVE